jgi:hypothetical protein
VKSLIEEEVEQSKETAEDESKPSEPFDVSTVAKALVLFGLSILVTYLVLRYLAVTTYADSMWFATSVLQPGAFEGVVTVTIIFFFFGAIAYFIHLEFMKLAMIAEEVLGTPLIEDYGEEERTDLKMDDNA